MCKFCSLPGLLLREIKDFWRVALLLSTLLYPNNIDSIVSTEHFDLDKRRKLFKQIEEAITKQGIEGLPLICSKLT